MVATTKKAAIGRAASALLGAALLIAGCSGGEPARSEASGPQLTAQPITVDTTPPVETGLEVSQVVTLDYVPNDDGFGFANYGGGNAPAALTVNLARRLYGDEQACASVNDAGECTPQPVILQLIEQANRAMAGGLCEGFAVLSLRLYQEGATASLLGQEAIVAALEQGDPRVAAELAFWFVTQFASETQAAAAFYREQTPSEIVATLADDFANPLTSAGYTLGLYSAEGGHAVTPYAVEAIENGSRIYIYDSNWPTETRWIDVVENVWTYALAATNPSEAASAWTGSTGTLELTPMASRQPPFSCAFCPQPDGTKSMTLLTAAGSSDSQLALQVVDDEGRRLGVFDGQLVNEIPGAVYRYIATSNSSDPVLVLLPPSVESYTADVETLDDSTDGAVSLFVAQDGAAARVETTIADVTDDADDEPVLAVTEDEGYEINDLDEAAVDIADQSVAVSVVLQDDQELAFQFTAPPPPPLRTEAPESGAELPNGVDTPEASEPATAPHIVLTIATDAGETVAEVEIEVESAETAPEEIVIEIDEEGEVELVVEEIEARPASVVAELRELVAERLEGEPEDDPWFEEAGDEEGEPFILDLEDDFWDEEVWEDDWHEEDSDWVWVESEDFVEWVEDEGEGGFVAALVDDEFIAQIEEIVERTEELIEELPDRIEGEWGEDGWAVEVEIVEVAEELLLGLAPVEDPPNPIEQGFAPPEDEPADGVTHNDILDPLPDITMPDWDWGDDVDDGIWLDIPDITLPEWDTDDDDIWFPDDDADDPDWLDDEDWPNAPDTEQGDSDDADDDEADDQSEDDGDESDTETTLGEGEEQEESPSALDSIDELLDGESGPETPEGLVIPDDPPPQPSWSGDSYSTWEDLADQTSTATNTTTTTNVTSTLGFNSNDGYWYQQVTTATTVTETETVSTISSQRYRTDEWWCYDDGYGQGSCGGGTYYGETISTTTVADPTVVSTNTTEVVTTIPANCSQGGWTGFGDWCIVGNWNTGFPNNRNEREVVQFTVPDDPDVTGERRRIVITAESNLRYNQFNQNNQHGDPYIYLYEDDDPDVGDHTGDLDEYTRGTFIESDDDGGRDCSVGGDSHPCNNPPADAVDEAEFPNDTIVGYSEPRPVIQNTANAWDSEIDRLMEPGDYAVEGTVYNANNSGWYRLTISDETADNESS